MGGATIVGVDLGGTSVSAGAVAEDGVISRRVNRRISAHAAEQVVVEEVLGAIAEVLDESAVGVGCGVPSVVDVAAGVVFDVDNIPSWKRVPLKACVEERFGLPTTVNNDANAFVVGEHVYGKGRGFNDLVGVTLGTGLGAGVILGGRLHSGRSCGAGEIGAIPFRDENIEAYCSGQFFKREADAAGEDVYARARAGEAGALVLYQRFGVELAHAVEVVLYAFDPEAVIFGGSIAGAFDLFEPGLRQGLESFAYQHVLDDLVIDRSELDDAAVMGAAALYVEATGRR